MKATRVGVGEVLTGNEEFLRRLKAMGRDVERNPELQAGFEEAKRAEQKGQQHDESGRTSHPATVR